MEVKSEDSTVKQDVTNNSDQVIKQKIAALQESQKNLQDAIDANLLPANVIEQMQISLVSITTELQQYEGCNLQDNDIPEPADEIDIVDASDDAPVWEADAADLDLNEASAAQQASAAVTSSVAAKVAAPKASTTPAMKFAPNLTPVQGTFTVCGISIQWSNDAGAPVAKVGSAARQLASNYSRLSSGKLIFKPTAKTAAVKYTHTAKNIKAAVSSAKSIVNGGTKNKFNRYAVVTHGLGTSHSAGNTSILRGTLYRDWWHEMGHVLPNNGKQRVLGHAGKYVTKNGKTTLDAYGDGSSFMGRYSTANINPPQRYYLGWAGDNKTAQYDFGDGEKLFSVAYPYSKNIPADAVTGVLIPRTEARPLFAGIIPVQNQLLFAVWYMTDGGTQRTAVFNKSATVEGLFFQRVATTGNASTLSISPAPTKTPATTPTTGAAATTKPKNKPNK